MKRVVKIKFSDGVEDASSVFYARNEEDEVYLCLDQVTQFSFGKSHFNFMLAGFDVEGCFCVYFPPSAMGEFHRIKREVEEYMGIAE